jgi:aldehyde dehydrogenase (NAD+)
LPTTSRSTRSLVPWSTLLSGQNCCAATRYLISRERHDEFVQAVAEKMEALKVGDPLDEDTEIGPLVK